MKLNLQTNIIISVILGVLAGFFAADYLNIYTFLGKTFINLLKYIVVPLVVASLITGIISLGSLDSLRQMGLKTLAYFIVTTIISSSIGLALAVLLNPGKGFIYENTVAQVASPKVLTVKQMLVQIFPMNFFDFMSGGNMLFVIILSIVFGIVILAFGRQISFPIDELFEGFNDFMMIITNWIITISPIGIFGLVARLIIETGIGAFIPLLKYMSIVAIGLGIHALIVLPFILKTIVKCSPIGVAKDVFTSLATGFSTASSAATLPVLMDETRKKLKIPNKVASFVLPLGITINMDGTALFQAVATVFIAQIYGVELTVISLCIIIFTVLLASIGAAAIPSAGLITLSLIFTIIGVPIEGVAIIIGIDRMLDIIRTTVNLWGNTVATMVITKWVGEGAYDK